MRLEDSDVDGLNLNRFRVQVVRSVDHRRYATPTTKITRIFESNNNEKLCAVSPKSVVLIDAEISAGNDARRYERKDDERTNATTTNGRSERTSSTSVDCDRKTEKRCFYLHVLAQHRFCFVCFAIGQQIKTMNNTFQHIPSPTSKNERIKTNTQDIRTTTIDV
jgi:hypothetical protein